MESLTSLYELTNSWERPRGVRLVENFTGNELNTNRWNTVLNGSGGAIAPSDTVDGGLEIKSATNNSSIIDFAITDTNKVSPFNNHGFVQIAVVKLTDIQYGIIRFGMKDNFWSSVGSYVRVQLYGDQNSLGGSQENKISLNSDNFSVINTDITDSSSPSMYDWLTHRVESTSTTTTLAINGILKVTGSGVPDAKLMPYMEVSNSEGTASTNPIGNIRYMECYNT